MTIDLTVYNLQHDIMSIWKYDKSWNVAQVWQCESITSSKVYQYGFMTVLSNITELEYEVIKESKREINALKQFQVTLLIPL